VRVSHNCYRDLSSAKTSTVPGIEFGLDVVEGADLTKLNRPAFPKSRVEKELETERVRELIDRGYFGAVGVAVCDKNILVGTKRNADSSAGGMRVFCRQDQCSLTNSYVDDNSCLISE
jgi:hypothetical protein